jgi:hypothetical protein
VIRVQLNINISKYVPPCCYSTVTPNVIMSYYVIPCCYSTVTPNVIMSYYVRPCCYSTLTPNVIMSYYIRPCCYSTVTPMSLPAVQPQMFLPLPSGHFQVYRHTSIREKLKCLHYFVSSKETVCTSVCFVLISVTVRCAGVHTIS